MTQNRLALFVKLPHLNTANIEIKTYKVSTAKENVQKPLGIGNISKISLKPTWYPTQTTKKNKFKQLKEQLLSFRHMDFTKSKKAHRIVRKRHNKLQKKMKFWLYRKNVVR